MEQAASSREAVPPVASPHVLASDREPAVQLPRVLGSQPRIRLFVPSRGWGGRRRRELLLGAGAIAVIVHVALVGFILEAPRLWPAPPLKLPPASAQDPPTIDMVMDDAKAAGGSKQTPASTPSPPAPQTPPAPDSPQTQQTPPAPPDPKASGDLPPVPAAPPPPQQQAQAQPEVDLDPNGDVGYGRQDNAQDVPASPDDKHANKVPAYPRGAGLRGEQGTVEMLVTIGASGQVASAEIAVSSGHADLDRTAQRAVLGWRFHPAMQHGIAVPTQSMQVFNFRITE